MKEERSLREGILVTKIDFSVIRLQAWKTERCRLKAGKDRNRCFP